MPDTNEDQLSKLEAEVTNLEARLAKLSDKPKSIAKAKRITKGDDCGCDPDDDECLAECEDEMEKAKAKGACSDEDMKDGGVDDWSEEADGKKKDKVMGKKTEETKSAEDIAKAAADEAKAKEAEVAKAAADAKAAEVAKAAEEFVTIEGQKISKSDPHFAIFKAQADRLAKAEEEIVKANEAREFAEMRKRADDMFKHVPGTTDERAEMLKAIAKMPEALQKQFTTVLTSHEKIAKAAFETVGHNGGEMKKTAAAFEAKVNEIRKRDNLSRTEALVKARQEDPEAFSAYQGSN